MLETKTRLCAVSFDIKIVEGHTYALQGPLTFHRVYIVRQIPIS